MKKRLLLLLIGLVIFLVGCVQDDGDVVSGAFVGGTDGLEIRFASGEPPDRVFDDNEEDFDITIEIENVGEFDIPSNKIIATLSGIDTKDFGINNPNQVLPFPLDGKGEFNDNVIQGDENEIIFQDARYKHDLVADFETKIRADICYEYQTKATTKVCLKRDATDRDEDDICQINSDNVNVENSGAPVQIKDVRTRSSGTNEVQLTFVVEDKAAGVVHPPGTFTSKCVRDEDEEDKLRVEVFTGSGRHNIKCSQFGDGSSGIVKLTNNERPVRCRVSTLSAPESALEEPINIIASYSYRNAISKSLIIEDSEE